MKNPLKHSSRDPLMPRPPGGMRRGLILALLVHAVLIIGLAIGVNWNSSNPEGIQAELWAAVPQVAAPRAAAPEPPPPKPEKPQPVVERPKPAPPPPKPEPKPEPEPAKVLPDPQIAIEKAKREERERRLEAQREDEEKERQKKEAAKKLVEKKAAEKKIELAKAEAAAKALEARQTAEKAAKAELEQEKKRKAEELRQAKLDEAREKAEAKRIADNREEALKRMLSQAGGSTGEVGSKGKAEQNAAPSDGYAGRVKARVKPNIVFVDQLTENPQAEVLVRLAPDGRIISQKLVRSSGSAEWDQAVQRAIDRTEILPRDVDGRVPSSMLIAFRPRE